jgi:hypothetical protein
MLTIWVLLSVTTISERPMDYFKYEKDCRAEAKFFREDSPREIIYICKSIQVRK